MIRLETMGCAVDIACRGAELRRWRAHGHEMIWVPNPAYWAETAPLLFPVVGWTNSGVARVGGRSYPLGLHGFARDSLFAVEAQSTDAATLVLSSSPASRALYPFDFTLRVTYEAGPGTLRVGLAVDNTGAGPMPYACGLHPGFRWPFAGGDPSDYRIVFETAERPEVPLITAAGLFSSGRRRIPLAGRVLPLSPELFAAEALCFLDARSRSLAFQSADGPALVVKTEHFRHVALWSRPGAPFLSIESWSGYGDPDGYAGDLFDKPSMTILPPGATARHGAVFELKAVEAAG
jgi:galactose mutarotase-like enzyme